MKRQNLKVIVLFLVIVTGLYGLVTFVPSSPASLEDRESFETEFHYAFNFIPTYRLDQCVVGIQYDSPGPDTDVVSILFRGLAQYLFKEAPKAAFLSYRGTGGQSPQKVYFFFRDDCARKIELTKAGISSILKEHPSLVFKVLTEPTPPEILQEISGNRWIDSPDYDFIYWGFRKKASKYCDAGAWEEVARYHEDPENWQEHSVMLAYLYVALAYRMAPTERLKDRLHELHSTQTNENIRFFEGLIDTYALRSDCL